MINLLVTNLLLIRLFAPAAGSLHPITEIVMSEKIKSEMISRRGAFSLLGLAAALASAVPITVLTVSDAEAQTAGMERRQGRRTGRQ